MKKDLKYCPFCKTDLVKKNEKAVERVYCTSCDEFIYDNPAVGVGIVLVDGSKILLIKRNIEPKKGMWAFPGGFVEQKETVEMAALRELLEETGLKGDMAEVMNTYTEQTMTYGTVVVPIVKIHGYEGTPKAGDDVSEAEFFEISQVPELAFISHNAYFNDYIKDSK